MYKKFFLGAVKLTKNTDRDKYSYSGHGISFDIPGTFFIAKWLVWQEQNNIWCSPVPLIIKKQILILGKRPWQGLDDATLTAEAA